MNTYKTTIKKMIISLLVISSLLSSNFVYAEQNEMYYEDGFEGYALYTRPENYDIINPENVKITKENGNSKELFMFGDKYCSITPKSGFGKSVKGKIGGTVRLRSDNSGNVSFVMGLKSGQNATPVLRIENNSIIMDGNKVVVGVTKFFPCSVSFTTDTNTRRTSIYINGNCVLRDWEQKGITLNYDNVYLEKQGKCNVYVDGFSVYSGDEVITKITDNNTNNVVVPDLYINQYPYDFEFFNSGHINTIVHKYEFANFVAKDGNSWTSEALDFRNQNHGERLILTKGDAENNNDVFFDVVTNAPNELLPKGFNYKYFMLDGWFHIDSELSGYLLQIRDRSSGANVDLYPIAYNNGVLSVGNRRKTLEYRDSEGDDLYYHLEAYLDLIKKTCDVYLDGEMFAEGVDISKISEVSMIRTLLFGGAGNLMLKDWAFIGLVTAPEKKFVNGKKVTTVEHHSQMSDDDSIRKFLSTKPVFHGDSNTVYVNGERKKMNAESVFDSKTKELYVSANDLSGVIAGDITYDEKSGWLADGKALNVFEAKKNGGNYLAPARAIGSALGWDAKGYDYGSMVICSKDGTLPENNEDDAKPWLDEIFWDNSHSVAKSPRHEMTVVQEISNIITYERPKAAELRKTYEERTASMGHPRLILTQERVEKLKGYLSSDSVFQEYFAKIRKQADERLDQPLQELYENKSSNSFDTQGTAKNFSLHIQRLSLAYLLTGERVYADRVIKEIMHVSAFTDFNNSKAIDPGRWMEAIAIGFDWCYDAMTEEQRQIIADGITKAGLEHAWRSYHALNSASHAIFDIGSGFQGMSYFPKWKSNYIGFCTGGYTAAALSFADYQPDMCFDILENTLRSWEYSNLGYYPDGGWIEGKQYDFWVKYGMMVASSSLMSVMGDDYGIMDAKGVSKSLDATFYLSSKVASMTFSDDYSRWPMACIDEISGYYAERFNRPEYYRWRQDSITLNNSYAYPFDLIFYLPQDGNDPYKNVETVNYTRGTEALTIHEDYADPNATFVALMGGPTHHYHFHNDGGDFMIVMNGECWTHELGTADYSIGSNYTRYCGRTEGHNTLVINPDEGYSQYEQSVAEVVSYAQGDGGAFGVIDMTDLYKHHGATKVQRGIMVDDNFRAVTIRDEMNFSKEAEGYWFMHTKAVVSKISDNSVIMTQNGKSMFVQFLCEGTNASFNLRIMDAKPLPTTPELSGDPSDTKDVKKLSLYFKGSGDINITVKVSELGEKIDSTPISEWVAPSKSQDSEKYDFGYDLFIDGEKSDNSGIIYVSGKDGEYPTVTVAPHDSRVEAEVVQSSSLEQPVIIKFKVKGTDITSLTAISLIKSVTAEFDKTHMIYKVVDYKVSDIPEKWNAPEGMFDKTFDTRWTGYNKGDWAMVDLGEEKPVDSVVCSFWKGNERVYNIDVMCSNDGINFSMAGTFKSSGTTIENEIFEFPKVSARYIKIVGNGNSVNNVINLQNYRVMCKK